MRLIILICVAAAALWSGYWMVGSRALEGRLTDWLEARRAEGWQAEWASLEVIGFPNRFDTTVTELILSDPDTGVAWQTPFFQLLMLSYQPQEIIAVWPRAHTLATPTDRYEILSADMKASLSVDADTSLPLDEAILVVASPRLRATGWLAEAQDYRMAMRRVEDTSQTYDLGVETNALVLPVSLRRQLDPTGVQPDAIEQLRLETRIEFDAAWDRRAIEDRRPQPVRIELDEMRATWGTLDLRAAGEVTVDPEGRPSGEITVKATNWREILAVIERTGVLPSGILPVVERALEAIAGLSGPSDSLDIPVTFRDGTMRVGILPIGQAPVLQLR